MHRSTALLFIFSLACSSPTSDDPDAGSESAPEDAAHDVASEPADSAGADRGTEDMPHDLTDIRGADQGTDMAAPREEFVIVTFNTGTVPSSHHDQPPDDGYTSDDATITDEWYGNGLNFPPLIEEVRAFFDQVKPDVAVFQEIFWTGECPSIPVDAQQGFICEGWQDGDPTVVQLILGDDYQVACHPGKPDKCAAVKRSFGSFEGCDDAFCLEGLVGYQVDGCGSGARIARAVIRRPDDPPLTVVNIHSSSGFSNSDVDCRIQQIEQVFVDLGDGEPGVNGELNIVIGDLNTDPGRLDVSDASARRWNDFVGGAFEFQWHTEVGIDAPKTYGPIAIDHAASDRFEGGCWHPGVSDGRPSISDIVFFDHKPVVCNLRRP